MEQSDRRKMSPDFVQRVEEHMRECQTDRIELRHRSEDGIEDRNDIRRSIEARHAENIKKLDNISDNVDCLGREMRKFQEKWTQTLQVTAEARASQKQLRKAIIEKSTVSAVWAILAFVAYAAWEYFKTHLK